MGITTEYNPDLALRNIAEFKKGKRKSEEGKYKVIEIFKDNKVHFNGFNKV